jgi:uncharacterized protein (TIGR00369 family)
MESPPPDHPRDLAAHLASVACNRLLGLTLRAHDENGATVAMAPRPELAQEYGVVHGGFLAALADTAAVYALLPKLKQGERMTSIEFKVNFLAPADPKGGEIVATATIVKAGRTVRVVTVDVRQHDRGTASGASSRHVLTGLFTYAVLPASTS